MKLHGMWLTVLMRQKGVYALKVKLLMHHEQVHARRDNFSSPVDITHWAMGEVAQPRAH